MVARKADRRSGFGISGTNIGSAYSQEELALLKLSEQYKKEHAKRFLTVLDMYKICLQYGYAKPSNTSTKKV